MLGKFYAIRKKSWTLSILLQTMTNLALTVVLIFPAFDNPSSHLLLTNVCIILFLVLIATFGMIIEANFGKKQSNKNK